MILDYISSIYVGWKDRAFPSVFKNNLNSYQALCIYRPQNCTTGKINTSLCSQNYAIAKTYNEVDLIVKKNVVKITVQYII